MIIIQDTREKIPWNFVEFPECTGQIRQTVSAGDYILSGHETLITIDRKKRPAELANNLGMYQDRFERELQRMQEFSYRYVLCEFSYEKLLMFPKGSGLPRRVTKRIRAKGKFLVTQVARLSEEYDVEFVFCQDRAEAQDQAIQLFKEALEDAN